MYFRHFILMMFLKRIIFFIFVFNTLFYTVLGNTPDSLENMLKRATSDTAKVMVYNRFARSLLFGPNREYYQALQYANEGLSLAKKAQFDKGRAELYRTMGTSCYFLFNYEQALEHYETAINISEKLQDYNGMALNYYNMNLIYSAQSKIYYSLDVLQKALSLWKKTGNINLQIIVYKSIIHLYETVGEWYLAETHAEEALRLSIETGNQQQEASLYDLIASIHNQHGNTELADEYYQKSIHLYEELDDQLQVARITHNIAMTKHLKNPEISIDLLRKTIAIYEKNSPDNYQLFEIYNNLANIFQSENQDDSTKYYKEKALSKAIFSGNEQTIAAAYNTSGNYYMDHNDLMRAEKDFHKAYEIAAKNEFYAIMSDALSGLSLIKYRRGNYKIAIEYLRKYQIINDSLNREESKQNVQQLTLQYDFEKDMTEKNETIKTQLERQQRAMMHQKRIVAIISIALMCAAILLLFIFRSNKRNRQANKKLELQHGEILHINDKLHESHHELSQYKDNLEEMVKIQTAKLRQSEIRLRTLSDNLPGGCIYQKHVSEDGKEVISYISSTAEEWLGLSAETIMEDIEVFYRQMVPEDHEKKRKIEQECIYSMSSYSCEYRMMKGDQEVWLLENAMPRIYKNRDIVWDCIIVNITDRKKYEKEIIEAKEQAEESDRLKSSFLANMSHEIRTPMNGIVGFLGFIERDELPAEKRNIYTGIIRNNVQQLLQLIGDIIDISKIDSNLLSLHQISFDLNNLLDELEIFFQDFILKRDKKMELMLDRSHFISPCIIQSDPVRIRQIFSNLIGNSVKFTEKGYIRFGYNLTEDGDKLYFFVEDTGIGIPETKQKQIFERFRQAHDKKTQTLYGGTGLGLAISKSLVELMGGNVGVESKEGIGSTFYFTLPFLTNYQ